MIKFGTGGWRAVIGEDFTRENVMRVAQGLCDLMHEHGLDKKPVIVGRDRRFLSDSAAEWVADVLAGNGIETITVGRSVPTPLIMHYVMRRELDFGIEITASHNPPEYNGIKVIIGEGRDASVEFTDMLEGYIARVDEIKTANGEAGHRTVLKNPFNEYIDDILKVIDIEAIKNSESRVLFDPMHGSGVYPLMCILYTARCTIDLMNENRDAYFGGNMPAPSQGTLHELSENVVKGGYDLGIALDGDGDRLGIIGSDGEYIGANEILSMLYYYLHEYKGWRGPVVRNFATTHMLDKMAASFGESCYEVPIGFKYISSKLDEVDAVLGGESSGGLTVRGHIHGKDSIYAAALFVEMLTVTGKSPKQFYRELEERYGRHTMVEDNIRFPSSERESIYGRIIENKELPHFDRRVERVGYADGCKVYFEGGDFVICRFSGTEPVLRIFAESLRAEDAAKYIRAFREMLGL